jgi:hypothetical protein
MNDKIIHLIDEKTKIGDAGDDLLLLAEVDDNTYSINDPRYRKESDNISLEELFKTGSKYENMILDFVWEITRLDSESLRSWRITIYRDQRTQEV